MLQLSAPAEPEWLTLIEAVEATDAVPAQPAVRVQFAPVGPSARDAADGAVAKLMSDAEHEIVSEVAAATDDGKLVRPLSASAAHFLKLVSKASSAAIIREGIRAWEGIGDADGLPLAVSPRSIDWFIGHDLLFARADALYVLPAAKRDAEKNASAGSPAGTGTRAMPARNTANSAAARPKKAAAAKPKQPRRSART